MANFQVTLTEAQEMALSYAALSPAEWIENAATSRCQTAIDEIAQITINKCLETSTQIPGSKEDMVFLAFNKGWVRTAAVANAEYMARMQAGPLTPTGQ